MIQLISSESGDWKVLKVNGVIRYEGHSIAEHEWLELIHKDFTVDCEEIEISDEEMESGEY